MRSNLTYNGIHPVLRAAVMKRDRRTCRYCGRTAVEIDHIEPRAHGGLTVMANLAASCRHCNRSKGDKNPLEWEIATRRQAAQMPTRRLQVKRKPKQRVKRIPGYQPRPYLADLLRAIE